ncbi:hypothetical protein AVEN_126046-1 [Araneus ventricosus]|uniref:Uncharacterized protein n=1 Tax=Araneus ventricosus TaxID=182803 RepID=A0A4Y2EW00_ARAVE|nr:hypothetical protein AVEN_126046-1 [Araneus ventricosus]
MLAPLSMTRHRISLGEVCAGASDGDRPQVKIGHNLGDRSQVKTGHNLGDRSQFPSAAVSAMSVSVTCSSRQDDG